MISSSQRKVRNRQPTIRTAHSPRFGTTNKLRNNLAGFQTGGDIWVGLFQGLRLGTEGKVGLYNNHYNLTNRISTTRWAPPPPTLFEKFTDNKVAFLTEGSVDLVADVLPTVSIRVGYEVLFMD